MKNFLIIVCCLGSLAALSQQQFDREAAKKAQKELNIEYEDKDKSPLTPEDRENFKGLDFFPVSEKYFVVAHFTRTETEKPFEMKTTGARRPLYQKYGELAFALEGKNFKLNLYQNIELSKKDGYHDYLFLPFSDLTSGKESYIGGRYIDVRIPKGDTMAIDFNQAYNPYCAYNHKYSCPIVPQDNDLDIEIRAGVKKFLD
ncbi:MAG TPA: DUF1684 domain-containing protein [Flavobacterium sp.]|nr:DUF1684 domain-containing protein [Flavobacterium sp.]